MIDQMIANSGGRLFVTEFGRKSIDEAVMAAAMDQFYRSNTDVPNGLTYGESLVWSKGVTAGQKLQEEYARAACERLLEVIWKFSLGERKE